MANENQNQTVPENAAEGKAAEVAETAAVKEAAPAAVEAQEKKANAKKTAVKKAPAKKAAPKKAPVKKEAALEEAPAKKAPAKKAAPKKEAAPKAAAKKAPAKKAPAKKAPAKKAAPKNSEAGVYVVQTVKRVTETIPAPLNGYNDRIMRAVTTGVDFVEELSKNALTQVILAVDQGKQKVNERKALVSVVVKKVTDDAAIKVLTYNEKYVKKALESGKKTLETGTDLVEDMGMVAMETLGAMAENGKKIAAGLPMAGKVKALTGRVLAMASK